MKKQQGFAIVETILVLVIVAIIAAVGYLMWQRHNKPVASKTASNTTATTDDTTDKGSLGKACTAGDMKGKLYTAPKAAYSICIPNGWSLEGDSNGQVLIGEGTDLDYVKDAAPKVNIMEGGHDGAFEFTIYFDPSASGAPSNFNTVGQFKADNVIGIEYARTETRVEEGLGGVPKGTLQHAYYFEHAGKSVEIDYNLMPGKTDHTDAVLAVAKTLIFN